MRLLYICVGVVVQSSIFPALVLKTSEQQVQSYQSCKLDVDCKPNSFCFGNNGTIDGKCKCSDRYELFRNSTYYECFLAAKLGESCDNDLQCQALASSLARCNDSNICECNEESQNYKGICLMKIKIFDICLSDGNCYQNENPLTNSFCYKGRCDCNKDQKPSQDRTRCVVTRKLGETCTTDEECLLVTPNSKCMSKCVCGVGYTETRNLTSCIEVATQFDQKCEFDGQCSKFLLESICNNGTCGCNPGHHGYGVRCVSTRKVGDKCEEDAQCYYEKKLETVLHCDNGTCRCMYGTDSNNTCKIKSTAKQNNLSCAVRSVPLFVVLGAVLTIYKTL